MTGQVEKTSG